MNAMGMEFYLPSFAVIPFLFGFCALLKISRFPIDPMGQQLFNEISTA